MKFYTVVCTYAGGSKGSYITTIYKRIEQKKLLQAIRLDTEFPTSAYIIDLDTGDIHSIQGFLLTLIS